MPGLVPTVHASGGKSWHGPTSPQANHYLRWAFVEAANAIPMHRHTYADRHVIELYDRLKKNKCHGKAAVAVARHLAEASWWILKKRQPYRPPHAKVAAESSSRNG
jgi:transposase